MGYRSDVALALTKNGVEALQKAIAESENTESREAVTDFLEHSDKHLKDTSDGSELWFWNSVKWYEFYPEVSFLESFMVGKVDEEDYRFMRIGEEYDDLCVEGCFCDDDFELRLERSIEFAEV